MKSKTRNPQIDKSFGSLEHKLHLEIEKEK